VEIERVYRFDKDAYSWLERTNIEDEFNDDCEVDSNGSDETSNKDTH